MKEATKIHNSIQYHCYDKKQFFEFTEKDPFIEVEDQIAVRHGYTYKIW